MRIIVLITIILYGCASCSNTQQITPSDESKISQNDVDQKINTISYTLSSAFQEVITTPTITPKITTKLRNSDTKLNTNTIYLPPKPTATIVPCMGIPFMEHHDIFTIDKDVCAYSIKSTVWEVLEYYKKKLPEIGIKISRIMDKRGGGYIIVCTSGSNYAYINIMKDEIPDSVLVRIDLYIFS
jgi:hypothetical protein